MEVFLFVLIFIASLFITADGSGFRLVGSSGCAAQMVFLPPFTNTAVFIDNYHVNFGGPGFNVETGEHSNISFVYPGTNISVFGTEFNLSTNTLRLLQPMSNTFCSAGSFFPDGTLLNVAGADVGTVGVAEGFDKLRRYAPGPCPGGVCTQDWVEQGEMLQHTRWYPSAQTLVDGTILVVGGAEIGGLVVNEADINVPTYELIFANGSTPPEEVFLPILNFSTAQNLDAGLSYNLYPKLHLLPNPGVANHIFTIAGNQTIIWDYLANELIRTLPDTPLQPRTTPSQSTSVLLPLVYPDYEPTVLLCGGSSGDVPAPKALDDCYTIKPLDEEPVWIPNDNLPNGPQVMSDGLLLPDGTVLIINGAHTGAGGGFMADDPVFFPLIFTPSAPAGKRFVTMPPSNIPRLYHSVATLLPSGEVLVAGSNPSVTYSRNGTVPATWPVITENGGVIALQEQQRNTSAYPTEYRVEIFSPPYMSATERPEITSMPASITFGSTFQVKASISGRKLQGNAEIILLHPGFHTHAHSMGQRMIVMGSKAVEESDAFNVIAPPDASVIPPGIYLLFAVQDGIPSEGLWLQLS